MNSLKDVQHQIQPPNTFHEILAMSQEDIDNFLHSRKISEMTEQELAGLVEYYLQDSSNRSRTLSLVTKRLHIEIRNYRMLVASKQTEFGVSNLRKAAEFLLEKLTEKSEESWLLPGGFENIHNNRSHHLWDFFLWLDVLSCTIWVGSTDITCERLISVLLNLSVIMNPEYLLAEEIEKMSVQYNAKPHLEAVSLFL